MKLHKEPKSFQVRMDKFYTKCFFASKFRLKQMDFLSFNTIQIIFVKSLVSKQDVARYLFDMQ